MDPNDKLLILVDKVKERALLVYQMFQSCQNKDGSVSKAGIDKLKGLLKGCLILSQMMIGPNWSLQSRLLR
jgi:hypothetical protein